MISALRELLLPQTTVLTPNTLEARRLVNEEDEGDSIESDDECGDVVQPALAECARRLLDYGCEYVLLTGTHAHTPQVVNTLYDASGVVRSDVWERLPHQYHGSGCTLASAVAAQLAMGLSVAEAVRAAQEFTWHALSTGFRTGMGQLIPNRFFKAGAAPR
jgi:hydroxymethylpyrimidine/phosphomethylpyrimidine kinase